MLGNVRCEVPGHEASKAKKDEDERGRRNLEGGAEQKDNPDDGDEPSEKIFSSNDGDCDNYEDPGREYDDPTVTGNWNKNGSSSTSIVGDDDHDSLGDDSGGDNS
eukprot:CAMPEP_0113583752 /NCGR_PEP_ID=MMETSP0015_2-20120614/32702_1 /TAXON_ID=2838 /ORGANISM="Odontella" /LENGTH=104 /DNA_ID=CAMNT_0000488685 /DNA_START=67 /DNA_END=378 /DNA_ORIENTATION=+ /assembly_acc=CAM_ASM_000160